MDTKGTRLAAILGIGSVVLSTGVGVYAAKNDTSLTGALNNQRPQMDMRQPIGSGDMMLPPKMDGFNPEKGMPKGGKENRFGFAFIDQESLTDEQKSEIEKFQDERDEAIKKVNDEFFDKLEKFISEEKLEEYENFVENHENMAGMPHEKGEHKMKGASPFKTLQKPKEIDEE